MSPRIDSAGLLSYGHSSMWLRLGRPARVRRFASGSVVMFLACNPDVRIGSSGEASSSSGSEGASNESDSGDSAGDDAPLLDVEAPQEECDRTLKLLVRDFRETHPDFEVWNKPLDAGVEYGIVEEELGPDGKPVYRGGEPDDGVQTTTSELTFSHWYNDSPGTNLLFERSLDLTEVSPGLWEFDSANEGGYFPIDDEGFGNFFDGHNYHFTTEIHTTFDYVGGETFTFTGDDDVFVFINGHLAIDIGGVHGLSTGALDLDEQAGALGISPGGNYPLDFFHAERATSNSNFKIQTSIACLVPLD